MTISSNAPSLIQWDSTVCWRDTHFLIKSSIVLVNHKLQERQQVFTWKQLKMNTGNCTPSIFLRYCVLQIFVSSWLGMSFWLTRSEIWHPKGRLTDCVSPPKSITVYHLIKYLPKYLDYSVIHYYSISFWFQLMLLNNKMHFKKTFINFHSLFAKLP